MPYLSASEAVIHKEALHQVYVPLPLPFACYFKLAWLRFRAAIFSLPHCTF